MYRKAHHHLTEKAANRTGKIFTRYTSDKDLVTRIYKEFKIEKKKNLNKIWDNKLNRELLKDKTQMTEIKVSNVQYP